MSVTLKNDLRSRWAALSVLTTAGATVDLDTSEQGTMNPRVVVQRSEYRNFPHLGGVDDSLIFETFTIYSIATSTNEAESISDAICEDIEALSGNVGASRKVAGTEILSKSDDFYSDDRSQDVGDYQVTVTALVQHVPQ